MAKNKFYTYISWLKAISIIMIVYRAEATGIVGDTINAFSMPLFFIASGFLFVDNKYETKTRIMNLLKRLMIPYFFITLARYVFWLVIGKDYGIDAAMNIPLLKPFIGTFYGCAVDNYMIHAVGLWFLPCLFITMLYYIFFFEGKSNLQKTIFLFVFALIAILNKQFMPMALPWGMDIALTLVIFFSIGNIIKSSGVVEKYFAKSFYSLMPAIILFALVIILSPLNSPVAAKYREYNNFALYIITGLSGAIGGLFLSIFLDKIFGFIRPIKYISENTMVIFGFHAVCFTVMKAFLVFILNKPASVIGSNPWLDIAFTALAVILLIPVIWFCNKYIPFLVGQKRDYKIKIFSLKK